MKDIFFASLYDINRLFFCFFFFFALFFFFSFFFFSFSFLYFLFCFSIKALRFSLCSRCTLEVSKSIIVPTDFYH